MNVPNPIGVQAYGRVSGLFFVGSGQPSTGDNGVYAVAVAGRGSPQLTGIAFPTASVNGVEQANPLWGAQINLLGTTGRLSENADSQTDAFPVLTRAGDPDHLYVISSYSNNASPAVTVSPQVLDGNGLPVSSIDALAGSLQGAIFMAVSPQGGVFGDPGSIISYADLNVTQTSGMALAFSANTMPVDRASSVVAIGSPLVSLTAPQLYVSSYRNRYGLNDMNISTLFFGATARGGGAPTDGCYGVSPSLGIGPSVLALVTIAPPSAITSDSIVAATGANSLVTIHYLSTLLPSVGTQYLVVVGGVGAGNVTPTHVYAMPLVSWGALASVNAAPSTMDDKGIFLRREFTVTAVNPGDLYTSSSIPARVGGGAAPGIITSLDTSGDSVIISVEDSATQAGGIYYSQAIFDNTPKIIGWSAWQRAVLTEGAVAAAVFDKQSPQFWYTTALTTTVQTVIRTEWEKNTSPLAGLLHTSLPLEKGGVQGVTDLIETSSLFSQVVGQRSSAALFTGFQSVILAQTAGDTGNVFSPVTAYPVTQACTDGTLAGLSVPAQYISMSGGVLQSLGALIASTVVSDGVQSWIFVGGNGGLAVLALPTGAGIANNTLRQNFVGLAPELTWQRVGDYTNVRKLASQNGFLYLLTDTLFERVAVTQQLISNQTPFTSTQLAQAATLPDKAYLFFSDVIVSEPLVVLATSSGLLRTGNGSSVQTATSQADMKWTQVIMPESAGWTSNGCATRLWAITQTGQDSDLYQGAPGVSGNLYVLAGNVSQGQSFLYRYVITADNDGVNDQTVQLFNDFFILGTPTYLQNMGYYRNFFYSDGLLWSVSRSRYLVDPVFVQSLSSRIKVGSRSPVAKTEGFFTDALAHSVGQLKRLSGLGSWIIPGDFGLVVHA